MSEEKKTGPEGAPEQQDGPGYIPASPTKRVLAWMGIVYMVLIIALSTYGLATGTVLHGLAGLMLAPAFGALAVIQLLKAGQLRRAGLSWGGAAALGVVAALVCLYSLADGLLSLTAVLGG